MVHVMHCEGRGWEFSGNDEFYMHLRGNHAQIRPVGELSVKFHDGDEYVWSTVSFPLDIHLIHLQLYKMYARLWESEPVCTGHQAETAFVRNLGFKVWSVLLGDSLSRCVMC